MRKTHKLVLLYIVLIVEVILFVSTLALYNQQNSQTTQTTEGTFLSPEEEAEQIVFPPSELTLERYWYRMPVTYSINPICGKYETYQIERAMSDIKRETYGVVFFEEAGENEESDLWISCSFRDNCYKKTVDVQGSTTTNYEEICAYTKGIAQITEISDNKIEKAGIVFIGLAGFSETGDDGPSGFSIGRCGDTTVEKHELLHALGYEHVEDESSIMYPEIESVGFKVHKEGECINADKKIDTEIVNDLIRTYKDNPALAGRVIGNITGKTLSAFGITVIFIALMIGTIMWINRVNKEK